MAHLKLEVAGMRHLVEQATLEKKSEELGLAPALRLSDYLDGLPPEMAVIGIPIRPHALEGLGADLTSSHNRNWPSWMAVWTTVKMGRPVSSVTGWRLPW